MFPVWTTICKYGVRDWVMYIVYGGSSLVGPSSLFDKSSLLCLTRLKCDNITKLTRSTSKVLCLRLLVLPTLSSLIRFLACMLPCPSSLLLFALIINWKVTPIKESLMPIGKFVYSFSWRHVMAASHIYHRIIFALCHLIIGHLNKLR